MLVVQFSGGVNARAADNAGAYGLAPVVNFKASGKGKNRKPATTKLGAPVPPASAVYSASTDQVTLTPRGKLDASKREELIVNGTLIVDRLGREIDGADDGQAGSDYIATISGTRVTSGGLPSVRTADGGLRTAKNGRPRARIEARLVSRAFEIHFGGRPSIPVEVSKRERHDDSRSAQHRFGRGFRICSGAGSVDHRTPRDGNADAPSS